MSTEHARQQLEAFRDGLPPFSAGGAIRNAARDRPEIQDAAVEYLERTWVSEPGGRTELTSIALLALSSSDDHLRCFADRVLFRLPSPADYRYLIPLLRGAIDDAGLAELITSALASDDDQVAANALDMQYHCYGFPDRFALPPDHAALIAERISDLRDRARPGSPLAAALDRYTPP